MELNRPVGAHLWRHPASSAACNQLFLWILWRHVTTNSRPLMFGHFRPYSLLTTLLQQWLDLVQPVALFVFSSSTTSVKILGLLPLFAAVIAKLILRFSPPCLFLFLLLRIMERKTFFFVYTASQTACLLTATPSPPPYPSLITKAAAVFMWSCDYSDELQ